MVNPFQAVTDALVRDARAEIAKARQADRERDHGARGIALGFYSKADATKTIDDIRWSAWLVTWSAPKQAWVHRRRLSGPLPLTDALDRVTAVCKARGLPRVD